MSGTSDTTHAPGGPSGVGSDAEMVRRLVAEVVRRIRAAAPAPTAGPPRAEPRSGAPTPAVGGHPLSATVVTLGTLEQLPAGTRRIIVAARAVITPSAREHAADAGIEIVRGAALSAAAAVRPFFVAQADCGGSPLPRAAALVRAVPGGQQLPTSGLGDLLTALATHADRDAAWGILLTGRPALGAAAANRHPALRAVTGRDVAALREAVIQCGANLLVADPAAFPAGSLERLCAEVAGRPPAGVPAELAGPPEATACGCQGKHH